MKRIFFSVVVDLSDKDSIEMAGSWKQDIYNNNFMTEEEGVRERKKSMKSQLQVPILLLGNKLDQVSFFKPVKNYFSC